MAVALPRVGRWPVGQRHGLDFVVRVAVRGRGALSAVVPLQMAHLVVDRCSHARVPSHPSFSRCSSSIHATPETRSRRTSASRAEQVLDSGVWRGSCVVSKLPDMPLRVSNDRGEAGADLGGGGHGRRAGSMARLLPGCRRRHLRPGREGCPRSRRRRAAGVPASPRPHSRAALQRAPRQAGLRRLLRWVRRQQHRLPAAATPAVVAEDKGGVRRVPEKESKVGSSSLSALLPLGVHASHGQDKEDSESDSEDDES